MSFLRLRAIFTYFIQIFNSPLRYQPGQLGVAVASQQLDGIRSRHCWDWFFELEGSEYYRNIMLCRMYVKNRKPRREDEKSTVPRGRV
jgi:hypothetical protein